MLLFSLPPAAVAAVEAEAMALKQKTSLTRMAMVTLMTMMRFQIIHQRQQTRMGMV